MGNASPEPALGPESRAAALKSSLLETNLAPCASSKWVGRSSPASAGAQKVPATLPRGAAFSPGASSVRASRTRSGAWDSASPAPHPSPALTRGLADPSPPPSRLQGTPPRPAAALQGVWAGSPGARGAETPSGSGAGSEPVSEQDSDAASRVHSHLVPRARAASGPAGHRPDVKSSRRLSSRTLRRLARL